MAIYIGSKKVKDVYYGNRKVAKIYKGSNLIYKSTPETVTFTITPTPSDATIKINNVVQNSVEVEKGSTVTWSVEKTGYVTQSGEEVVNEDTTKEVTLEAKAPAERTEPTLPTDTFYAWVLPDTPTGTAWYTLTETPVSNEWMYVANAGDPHSLPVSQYSGVADQTLEQIGGTIDGTTLTAQGRTFERNSSYDGEFYLCTMWVHEANYTLYLTKKDLPVSGDVVYHWDSATGAITNAGTVGTEWEIHKETGILNGPDGGDCNISTWMFVRSDLVGE